MCVCVCVAGGDNQPRSWISSTWLNQRTDSLTLDSTGTSVHMSPQPHRLLMAHQTPVEITLAGSTTRELSAMFHPHQHARIFTQHAGIPRVSRLFDNEGVWKEERGREESRGWRAEERREGVSTLTLRFVGSERGHSLESRCSFLQSTHCTTVHPDTVKVMSLRRNTIKNSPLSSLSLAFSFSP